MPNLWPTKLYLTKSSVLYRETGFKIFLDVSSCDPGKVHLLLFLIFRFVFNFDKILYFHKYLDLCSITGSPTVCFFNDKIFCVTWNQLLFRFLLIVKIFHYYWATYIRYPLATYDFFLTTTIRNVNSPQKVWTSLL